ncbi:MAG: hypothetical protein ACXWTH_06090 [Methylosarcina sp.]
MMTQTVFYHQVMGSMERMTDHLALRAISGMLVAIESNPVTLNELCYLLDSIINKQKALVDELISTKNVGHISSSPGKSPTSSMIDNS